MGICLFSQLEASFSLYQMNFEEDGEELAMPNL